MLGLDPKRYVPVLLKRSAQEPVLIHPFAYRALVRENMFLNSQTELTEDQWYAKKHFFERLRIPREAGKVPEKWSDLVSVASALSYESVDLPCYSDEKRHVESLRPLLVGMTELFDFKWDTQNIGSCRNVLLSESQIKGCGRTLPVNNFWHRLSSGVSVISESVHSFLISHLIETTLPLGGLPAKAVYIDTESDDGKSLYLRAADSIRLAQIPERPTEDELIHLRACLEARHPGCEPKEIIFRVMAQYASNAYLACILQSTPDNLLLDGRSLDEEDWNWPRNPGQLILRAIFTYQGEIPQNPTHEFPWEKVTDVHTTFSIYAKSIRLYLEGLNLVTPHAVNFSEAWEKFLEHLSALWSHHGKSSDIRELFEEGRKISDGNTLRDWINRYVKDWQLLCRKSKPSGRYNLFISPDAFKDENFLSNFHYGKEFENYQRLGVLTENSFQLSKKLLSVAARSGICLPVTVDLKGKTIPNIFSLEEWWKKEVRTFQGWEDRVTAVLFSDDAGLIHRVPIAGGQPDIKDIESKRLIPISVVLPMEDGELELPLHKVFLTL